MPGSTCWAIRNSLSSFPASSGSMAPFLSSSSWCRCIVWRETPSPPRSLQVAFYDWGRVSNEKRDSCPPFDLIRDTGRAPHCVRPEIFRRDSLLTLDEVTGAHRYREHPHHIRSHCRSQLGMRTWVNIQGNWRIVFEQSRAGTLLRFPAAEICSPQAITPRSCVVHKETLLLRNRTCLLRPCVLLI